MLEVVAAFKGYPRLPTAMEGARAQNATRPQCLRRQGGRRTALYLAQYLEMHEAFLG